MFLERLIHPKTDLLQALEEFYLIADDIYDDIYWSLKRAVPVPSLSDNQKKRIQKVLSTSCVAVPMEKKNQAHNSQEGT